MSRPLRRSLAHAFSGRGLGRHKLEYRVPMRPPIAIRSPEPVRRVIDTATQIHCGVQGGWQSPPRIRSLIKTRVIDIRPTRHGTFTLNRCP
jgi:hypothetical protein